MDLLAVRIGSPRHSHEAELPLTVTRGFDIFSRHRLYTSLMSQEVLPPTWEILRAVSVRYQLVRLRTVSR